MISMPGNAFTADGTPHDGPPARHPSAIPVAARPYQGRSAGVVTRIGAALVDALVVIVALGGIYGVIAGASFLLRPRSFSWPAGLGWSIPVIGFVVVVPYFTVCWSAIGRSYGQALLGLRVITSRGRLTFIRALLRAVLCVVFPIGLLWVAISPRNRSVQDVILRTQVIYDWTTGEGVRS
jgi:RDD family